MNNRILAAIVRSAMKAVPKKVHQLARRLLGSSEWAIQAGRWLATHDAEVYLISFPKCGRTWLRTLIGRYYVEKYSLYEEEIKLKDIGRQRNEIPRFCVTHDDNPHWKTPKELEREKHIYQHRKVIFLVRDPRDVVVSLYFEQTKRRDAFEGSMSEFVRRERGSIKTMIEFFNIWQRQKNQLGEFLLVRYEDLHADAADELFRILDFLGELDADPGLVEEAVEFASFENMRRREKRESCADEALRPGDSSDLESYKTRQGKVGGFKQYLGEEEVKYINTIMRERLHPWLGYRPAIDDDSITQNLASQ